MKAEINQAYVNENVVNTQPQSPGTPNSFTTNMQICEPNDTAVTSPKIIFTIGSSKVDILPDEVHEIKMVTWHTRKMRQMSVFLVFFVIIALVMTGLFVWRTVFFDQLQTTENCNDKTCSTSASTKPTPPPCRHRAKAKPFKTLPRNVVNQLEHMRQMLVNHSVTSIANVVYMDKEIWSSFHGVVDPEAPNPKKPDGHSLFAMASIAKVFTSVMTFKMYKDRKVDTLDDAFVKYEPKFKIKSRFKTRKFVIRELLSHMSGLPREAPCYPDKQRNICPYNNSVMLDRVSDMYLLLKPGVKPSYSNLGFGLLGHALVNNLYNMTYEEWMKEKLFKPLGMNDTTFELPPRNASKIIMGDDGKIREPRNWGWINPAGGFFSSTSDIAKLEIDIFKSMDEESYLSPVFVNELFSPAYIFPSEKVLLGLPWEMYMYNGYLVRYKNGQIFGYSSHIFIIPELKLAFNVFYTVQYREANGVAHLFANLLTAFHEALNGNVTKITLPPNPNVFIGVYKNRFENSSVPGLSKIEVKQANDEMKLIFTYYNSPISFQLNFLYNVTFEIWDRDYDSNCMGLFVRGFDLERIYFDPISNVSEQSRGVRIYGVHPRGWLYFQRVAE